EQRETRNGELGEAREQQTATSEILRVISSSPTDIQPVFATIIRRAVQLSGARRGTLFRFDGALVHLVAHHNQPAEALASLQRWYPMRPARNQVSGRAILSRSVAEIQDVRKDPEYLQDMASEQELSSLLAVPMLRPDGAPTGVIVIQGSKVGAFATGHVELLKTFADQAVIAIENARLFNETKEALEQQTATGEILQVIARSPPDVAPVLEAVVQNASRLCGAGNVSLYRVEGDLMRKVAEHGPPITNLDVGETRPIARTSVSGRAI